MKHYRVLTLVFLVIFSCVSYSDTVRIEGVTGYTDYYGNFIYYSSEPTVNTSNSNDNIYIEGVNGYTDYYGNFVLYDSFYGDSGSSVTFTESTSSGSLPGLMIFIKS